MRTLALLSPKGGVGKTTTAVALAVRLAALGQRTLLIDLDPQGAAGHLLRVRPAAPVKAKRFWDGGAEWEDLVRAADVPGLDVLPAATSLRRTEVVLEGLAHPRWRLDAQLDGLAGWDRVVLDCPPGSGLLVENLMRAADLVVVPVPPSQLALRTLPALAQLAGHRAERLRPVVVMARGAHPVSTELRRTWPSTFATVVPFAEAVESAASARTSVMLSAPRSRVAMAYRALATEIEAALAATAPA